ncbi:MAG: [FeFe] hydrogenase H-cluster radical SAM maturase HydE [Chlamydiae bacterium]|nr:[FeFe] hydrogenase H-cluster radical SAM maturase HydE [Chlamydiota bacterium]
MEQETYLSKEEIIHWLKEKDANKLASLYARADKLTRKLFGTKVFFRGIIEFGNSCNKNCYYCGIRKGNEKIFRYLMPKKEIVETALWAYSQGYGSVVLQSGEIDNEKRVELILEVIKEIKKKTNLRITLSLGELLKESYLEFFKAGADRYLLRIETANKSLYEKLHPEGHSFDNRIECVQNLKSIGYQVGTGVMIGLPFQTIEDLAEDILFFKKLDIDMIGMGPFIPNEETPLFSQKQYCMKEDMFQLSLKMIALCRLYLKDVNISATTALQALNRKGREIALSSGANIIMPIITPLKYRQNYLLYPNKPCLDETAEMCKSCIENRIKSVNKNIAYNEPGDPLHFLNNGKIND